MCGKRKFLAASLVLAMTTGAFADDMNQGVLVSGNLRFGYIDRDEAGKQSHAAAVGGQVAVASRVWRGWSAGASVATSQKLHSGDNQEFFDADGNAYTILGEAWLEAGNSHNTITAGRFALDTPYADDDDTRMVPNRFQGVLLVTHIAADTTVQLLHLDQWAGIDAPAPDKFTDLAGSRGVNAAGLLYRGIPGFGLQAWVYDADDRARLSYAEVIHQTDRYRIGAQLAKQWDRGKNSPGPDADISGFLAGISVGRASFTAAYNKVFGIATNGFGGGPWFTSADDHTIADVENQEAVTFTAEFSLTEQFSFYVRNTHLHHGEDEADYAIRFKLTDKTSATFVYHDMHSDGRIALFLMNIGFRKSAGTDP